MSFYRETIGFTMQRGEGRGFCLLINKFLNQCQALLYLLNIFLMMIPYEVIQQINEIQQFLTSHASCVENIK